MARNRPCAPTSMPRRWRSRSTAAPRTTRSRSRRARPRPPPTAATTTPTATSARCGLLNRGCTAASACGRCRSRAIANVVRETPEHQRQQRPERGDRGPDPHHRLPSPGSPRRVPRRRAGRSREAKCGAAQFAQHGDRDHRVHHQRDPERDRDGTRNGAGRVTHLFAQRRDTGVAREREEQQPGGLQHATDAAVVAERQPRTVDITEAEDDAHDRREHRQHERDDDASQHRGLLDTGVVHRRQRDDRGNRHRVRTVPATRNSRPSAPSPRKTPSCRRRSSSLRCSPRTRRDVRARRRRCRRIADTARPAGPTTLRCNRRPRGDGQPDEQTRARGCRRRGERDEDARAHHRAEPDDHRVERAEPPLQRRPVRRAHAHVMLRQETGSFPNADSATPNGGRHATVTMSTIAPITTSGMVHIRRTRSAVSHWST